MSDNLPKDGSQLYLDAFFLTHSDNDHCRGIRDCFNLCSPGKSDRNKIRIDELCVPAKLMLGDIELNEDAEAIKNRPKEDLI